MEIDKNSTAYKAASAFDNTIATIAMPPALAMLQLLPWMLAAALFWNFDFFLANVLGFLLMPLAFAISVTILFINKSFIGAAYMWVCNAPMTIAGVILCWTGDENKMIEFLKVAFPFLDK